MMRFLIGVLTIMLLTGCTTPSDLRQGKPVFVAGTKKSPKQYAHCVFPKWQDLNAFSSMSETEDGVRLIMSSGVGLVDELLEIKIEGGGASVKQFQRIAWQQFGRGGVSEAVKSCI